MNERTANLVRLAAHPTTPEHEARTSAVIACRALVTEGLDSAAPDTSRLTLRIAELEVEAVVIVSKFDGTCRACGKDYDAGERVIWRRGKGAAHAACGGQWR